MSSVILKSLSAQNFASFADAVVFTTGIDTSKKDITENIFYSNQEAYNKISFVYGANGSGKTFFCKIIREIQRMVAVSPFITFSDSNVLSTPHLKGIDKPVTKFIFNTDYAKHPTTLGIEIVIDGLIYNYVFSINDNKVVYELLTKKDKRTEKLIERTSPSFKDIVVRSDLKSFDNTKMVVKEESLCLPVAALLNNELARKIVDAIRSIHAVNMAGTAFRPVNNEKAFSRERIDKYVQVLKKADPTIVDMEVSFEDEEVERKKIESDDFENREFITKKTTITVETKHIVVENGEKVVKSPVSFFGEESLGTVKLFSTLPHLYDVLENGGVLFIDEIENGLHLSLVKEIIGLFLNTETNPHNAQLICTSHQPLLLDGPFRRDQVWITSKNEQGKSSLYRLSESKTSRAKVNLINKVLENAFGCNPEKFFS